MFNEIPKEDLFEILIAEPKIDSRFKIEGPQKGFYWHNTKSGNVLLYDFENEKWSKL
jgi:hypothetical protein